MHFVNYLIFFVQHFAKMLQEKDETINKMQNELENSKNMNEKLNSIIKLLELKTNNE